MRRCGDAGTNLRVAKGPGFQKTPFPPPVAVLFQQWAEHYDTRALARATFGADRVHFLLT